ncbi:MAG: FadR/GntR family transcriptional regulator [Beijerinckiaceae bacterium]
MKRPRSFHAEVVEQLALDIAGGTYAVGVQLPTEPELCTRFGISRTVVREAVKTLVAKGLVTTGPRVGTRVAPKSEWNLFDPDVIGWRVAAGVDEFFVRDVIELRLSLEPAAAFLAAERATDLDRHAISAAFAGMVKAVEQGSSDYHTADLAFHTGIIKASHNQFFAKMTPIVEAVLKVSFRLSVKSRASAAASLPLHKDVLDAILKQDKIQSEAALRILIESARRDIYTDITPDDFARKGAA